MKYFKLLLAVFLLTVLPQLVKAEETLVPAAEDQPAASQASTPIEAGNKFCPVSGEKVGGMGEVGKYEHQSKNRRRVYPSRNRMESKMGRSQSNNEPICRTIPISN